MSKENLLENVQNRMMKQNSREYLFRDLSALCSRIDSLHTLLIGTKVRKEFN